MRFEELDLSQAMAAENALLSIGREYLPAVAILVLDGEAMTTEQIAEYYQWVCDQMKGGV